MTGKKEIQGKLNVFLMIPNNLIRKPFKRTLRKYQYEFIY